MVSDHDIDKKTAQMRTAFDGGARNDFATSFYDAMLEVSGQPSANVVIFAELHRLENSVFYSDPDLYAALRETGRDKFGIELPIDLNPALQEFQDQKTTREEFMEQYKAYAETVMGSKIGGSHKMIEGVLDQVEVANAEGVRVYFYDSLSHLGTEIAAVQKHFAAEIEAGNPAYVAAQKYLDKQASFDGDFFAEAEEFGDASLSFVGDVFDCLRDAALNGEITIEQFLEIRMDIDKVQVDNRMTVDVENAENIKALMGTSGIALSAGLYHARDYNSSIGRPKGMSDLDELLGGEDSVYTVELYSRPSDYEFSEPFSHDMPHAIFIADRFGGTGTYIPTDKSTSLIVNSPEVSAEIDGLGSDLEKTPAIVFMTKP